jgi:hypothetical protein
MAMLPGSAIWPVLLRDWLSMQKLGGGNMTI